MSNRRQIAAGDIRTPLLYALAVEHRRATDAKNTRRVQEIDAILALLNGLWPGLIPAAQPVQEVPSPPPVVIPPPAVRMAPYEPLAQSQAPPVLPPIPDPGFSLRDLLARAEDAEPQIVPARYQPEPNINDLERRAVAKGRVMEAVNKAAKITLGDQMRYELALQAKNGNARAMELLEPEAQIRGVSIDDMTEHIIADRRTRERRMMHVYAILARASAAIDQASGSGIDAQADIAIREIGIQED